MNENLTCVVCGCQLVNDESCERTDAALYTENGCGPFCHKHYEKMKETDDRLAREADKREGSV